MIITLLTYLIPVIQIILPLYLTYRIWTTKFALKVTWLSYFSHAFLALLVLFIIGRWDMVGYSLRYGLYIPLLIALLASYLKVKDNPWYESDKMRWHWGQLLESVLLIAGLIWSLNGMTPSTSSVEMNYPLKGDSYYVVQGGSTPILNYHGAASTSQTYALDFNQLNRWGFRAAGMIPKNLRSYAVFGDTVYSPIDGTVVQVQDSLSDQKPPVMQPKQPGGNHIWIKQDTLYVVLAHLKHQSVMIEEGDQVIANQPVAKVGNTGNTTEPHLHMHAVRLNHSTTTFKDSLLAKGEPVPITFDNTFLVRNSIL